MTDATEHAAPGQRIDVPSVPNLRDLGGYPVAGGGRVKPGQLYRSVELSHLHGDDLTAMGKLGIRTVIDLRTAGERSAEPDVPLPGAESVVCDVLADEKRAAPATMMQALGDPAAAQEVFGDGKGAALFEMGYREIVSLPSALSSYRTFFETVAQDGRRPLLFHCTTGKDRTGWATAATLLFLGVSREDVFGDYLLTNRDLLPALQPIYERFRDAGGDPRLLDPVFGVDAAYLTAALDEMHARFGSIEGYVTDGLRIDEPTQQRLKRELVEPAG